MFLPLAQIRYHSGENIFYTYFIILNTLFIIISFFIILDFYYDTIGNRTYIMSSILSPFLGILVVLIRYIKENKNVKIFYLYLIVSIISTVLLFITINSLFPIPILIITNPIFGKFPYNRFPFNKPPIINVSIYEIILYNLITPFQIFTYISNFILFYILYKFQNNLLENKVTLKYIRFLPIPFIIFLVFVGITNIYDTIPDIFKVTYFAWKFYPYRYNDLDIWKNIITFNLNNQLFLSDFIIFVSIILLLVSLFILKKEGKVILCAVSLVLLAISRYFAYNPFTGISLNSKYFYFLSFPFILDLQYQNFIFIVYLIYFILLIIYTRYRKLAKMIFIANTLLLGLILILGYEKYANLASLNLSNMLALLDYSLGVGFNGIITQLPAYLLVRISYFSYTYYSMFFTMGILIFSTAILYLIDSMKNELFI